MIKTIFIATMFFLYLAPKGSALTSEYDSYTVSVSNHAFSGFFLGGSFTAVDRNRDSFISPAEFTSENAVVGHRGGPSSWRAHSTSMNLNSLIPVNQGVFDLGQASYSGTLNSAYCTDGITHYGPGPYEYCPQGFELQIYYQYSVGPFDLAGARLTWERTSPVPTSAVPLPQSLAFLTMAMCAFGAFSTSIRASIQRAWSFACASQRKPRAFARL